jgi:hypothetical protein
LPCFSDLDCAPEDGCRLLPPAPNAEGEIDETAASGLGLCDPFFDVEGTITFALAQ